MSWDHNPYKPCFSKGGHWISKQLYLHSEKAMAPHSSTLAWKIPGTGEPGGLQQQHTYTSWFIWRGESACADLCLSSWKPTTHISHPVELVSVFYWVDRLFFLSFFFFFEHHLLNKCSYLPTSYYKKRIVHHSTSQKLEPCFSKHGHQSTASYAKNAESWYCVCACACACVLSHLIVSDFLWPFGL